MHAAQAQGAEQAEVQARQARHLQERTEAIFNHYITFLVKNSMDSTQAFRNKTPIKGYILGRLSQNDAEENILLNLQKKAVESLYLQALQDMGIEPSLNEEVVMETIDTALRNNRHVQAIVLHLVEMITPVSEEEANRKAQNSAIAAHQDLEYAEVERKHDREQKEKADLKTAKEASLAALDVEVKQRQAQKEQEAKYQEELKTAMQASAADEAQFLADLQATQQASEAEEKRRLVRQSWAAKGKE